jgi:hypothetical protein
MTHLNIEAGMPTEETEKALKILKDALAKEVKSMSSPSLKTEKKQDKKYSDKEKKEAAKTILTFWRSSRVIKNMYQVDGYKTYLAMLQSSNHELTLDEELNTLSQYMFGKTVAHIASDKDFPFLNPTMHTKAAYHRNDDLSSPFLKEIIKHFDDHPNLTDYLYIPFSILRVTPFNDVLNTYLSKHQKEIGILEKKESNIAFLKILKSSPSLDEITHLVQATGIVASPWQLAQYHTHTLPQQEKKKSFLPYIPMFDIAAPSTTTAFFSDKKLQELERTAKGKYPTHYLAQSLLQMFTFLKDLELDPESLKRIYIFLTLGLTFYKNNYPRFSAITYGIMHEMSLLIIKNKTMNEIINYDNFKKDAALYAISKFELDNKDDKELERNYQPIAFPANSGAHSFIIAMDLAKKMELQGKSPTIQIMGPMYYEFDTLAKPDLDKSADIYVISTGPIVSSKTESVEPGLDINKVIRRRMSLSPDKPLTLVADSTTGLYKNLKLDKDIQDFIKQGRVSIIVCESHQKFGLLHTDQAQYGRVFGVCSKKHFSAQLLSEYERNAALDLENIPDMRIGAFINIACGELLEIIKEQHFSNGDTIRQLFVKTEDSDIKTHAHEDTQSPLKELYFNVYSKHSALGKVAPLHVKQRDSFAHFKTTCIDLSNMIRISASASDKMDTLIEACELYFLSIYSSSHRQYQYFLTQYLADVDSGKKMSVEDEIIFFSLTSILGKNIVPVYSDNIDKIALSLQLDRFISSRDDSMMGRACFNALVINYQENANINLGYGIQIKDIVNHIKTLNKKEKSITAFLDIVSQFLLTPEENKTEKKKLALHIILHKNQLHELKTPQPVLSFDYSSHPLLEKSIFNLNQSHALTEPIFKKLLLENKPAHLAYTVNKLADNKILNKYVHFLTKNDTLSEAFLILMVTSVINENVFKMLDKDNKKSNDFAAAIKKLNAHHLISKNIISHLYKHPEIIENLIHQNVKDPPHVKLIILSASDNLKDRVMLLKTWTPENIKELYHFINREHKLTSQFNPMVINEIKKTCNEIFMKIFYEKYDSKASFFHSRKNVGKILKSHQIQDISDIESLAKKSKTVEKILNISMKY